MQRGDGQRVGIALALLRLLLPPDGQYVETCAIWQSRSHSCRLARDDSHQTELDVCFCFVVPILLRGGKVVVPELLRQHLSLIRLRATSSQPHRARGSRAAALSEGEGQVTHCAAKHLARR